MIKRIILFVIIFFVVFVAPYIDWEEVNLNPNDYARITDVDYKAVLLDDPNYGGGKMYVKERITFDIHAASRSNPFWELWRDLPEDVVDGLNVDYDVISVKQIMDNGEEFYLRESPQLYWEDEDYVDTYRGLGPNRWYHSYRKDWTAPDQYECLMIYINGIYREKVTYELEYIINNAALRYKDCSELYLSLYSGDSVRYLDSYKAQILIKNTDMPSIGNYYYNTFGTNSNEFPVKEDSNINYGYHTFVIDLDKEDLKFKPYNKYIEFDLVSTGEDSDKFTEYAPANIYSDDVALNELKAEQLSYDMTPMAFKIAKIVTLIICCIISLKIIKSAITKKQTLKKEHIFYEPTMKMDYFREIPSNLDPNFAEALVFCKHKRPKMHEEDGYSAIMLSLVRKGYIELERIDPFYSWTNENIKLIIKRRVTQKYDVINGEIVEDIKEYEKLTKSEELYYNLIVRHATFGEIKMTSLQHKISLDYENTYTFINQVDASIKRIGVAEGYFQKADYDEPKRKLKSTASTQMLFGIIFLTVVNLVSSQTRLDFAYGAFCIIGLVLIASSLYLKKIADKYILLTQFGEDEYVKWRGLYNFLSSETLMNERTVVELPLWEQYLVYATAFGISDKVIKAMKIRCSQIDLETSSMLRNPYYRSTNFRSSGTYFRHATHLASHRYSSYSGRGYGGGYGGGFGGHGGYGGGGRGGGGGRRRALNKEIFRLQA